MYLLSLPSDRWSLGEEVHHIHGDRDRMMPLRRVRPDHVVRGGGHLINLTHADEVNAYMAEKIRSRLL